MGRHLLSTPAFSILPSACTVGPDFRPSANALPATSLLGGRQPPDAARLAAWHEVDDSLISYTAEERRRGSLARNVEENELALSVAQRRYKQGAIDFLNVLAVQKALLDARNEAIRSNVAVSINLIKLFKALGGGWEGQFSDHAPPMSQANSNFTGDLSP